MSKQRANLAKLVSTEILLYTTYLIGLLIYAFYVIIIESSVYKNRTLLAKNVKQLNFQRESLDFEWNNYIERMFAELNIIYLALVPLIKKISDLYLPKHTCTILSLYSSFLMLKMFTIWGFMVTVAVNFGIYGLCRIFKLKVLLWLSTIITMFFIHQNSVNNFMSSKLSSVRHDAYNEFISTFYFMILRLCGYCMDYIDHLKKKDINTNKEVDQKLDDMYSFSHFLVYIYFPSFLFTSPFIPYKNFHYCLLERREKTSFKEIVKLCIRIGFSILLIEFLLRITSSYTILIYTNYVWKFFSVTSFVMSILIRGSLFTSKYIVYYGVPTLFNKMVGMKTTELPRCFALIHLNSEMWRYFDTGIYEFIKNYLYIPLGGSRGKKTTQLVSIVFSFVFISFWHGFGTNVSLWSMINCLMIISENVYFNFVLKTKKNYKILNRLDLRIKRILIAILLVISQMIMYLNSSFFLGSLNETLEMYKIIFLRNKNLILNFVVAFLGMYCNAQLRLELVDLFY